jgi:hypothetical protein
MNPLKIEIGDTVRIKDTSEYYKNGVNNPTCEGVYNKDDGCRSLSHRVDWANGMSEWYNLHDLTLIKKGKTVEFTKSDLKTGMFVKFRRGEYRVVLGDYALDNVSRVCLLNIKDSLLSQHDAFADIDIMAVYRIDIPTSLIDHLEGGNLELIWERTEQTPAQKEMEVLQEQAKALQEQITKLQSKL